MKTFNLTNDSDTLFKNAGTFWSAFYEGKDRVFSLFDSYSLSYQNIYQDALDAGLLFYRLQMPVLHRELIYAFEVNKEDYEKSYSYVRYGEAYKYGKEVKYGEPTYNQGIINLPKGLIDIDLICDSPADPSIVLIKNFDFFIKDNRIIFNRNPFSVFETIYENSVEKIVLYFRSAYFDENYIQDRLDVLLKTNSESTEKYKEFCNLCMDSIIQGTNEIRLSRILGLIFDIPCTEEKEIIEAYISFNNKDHCITDKNVYTKNQNANWIHPIGKIINPGSFLSDAIIELKKDFKEDLILEKKFLPEGFKSGLGFKNEDYRIYLQDQRYQFPINGREEDIRLFWDKFFERVIDSNIIKQSSNGLWLNPAKYIFDNLLYPMARIYKIDYQKTGESLNIINTKILDKLIPPGVLFSIQYDTPELEGEFSLEFDLLEGSQMIGYSPKEFVLDFNTNVTQVLC